MSAKKPTKNIGYGTGGTTKRTVGWRVAPGPMGGQFDLLYQDGDQTYLLVATSAERWVLDAAMKGLKRSRIKR